MPLPNEKEFLELVSYMLSHECLTEEELRDFGLYDELLFDYMSIKRSARAKFQNYACNIISLGENCFPISLCTKFGLNMTLAQGARRLPFDLAIHRIETVLELLENDFADYQIAAISDIKKNSPFFDMVKKRIAFNHDKLLSANYDLEIKRFNKILSKRVNAFREISGQNSLFIINMYEIGEMQIEKLKKLKNFVASKYKSNLLILNMSKPCAVDGLDIYNYSFPSGGYIWYSTKLWFTDEGYEFESSIIKIILAYVENHYPFSKEYHNYPKSNNANLFIYLARYHGSLGNKTKYEEYMLKALEECDYKPTAFWLETANKIIIK